MTGPTREDKARGWPGQAPATTVRGLGPPGNVGGTYRAASAARNPAGTAVTGPIISGLGGEQAYAGRLGKDRGLRLSRHFIAPAPPKAGIPTSLRKPTEPSSAVNVHPRRAWLRSEGSRLSIRSHAMQLDA
jgi:hypothetical protein